jgi:hypothetical protein
VTIDRVESRTIATLYGSGIEPLAAAVEVALTVIFFTPKIPAKNVGMVADCVTLTALGLVEVHGTPQFDTVVRHSGVTVAVPPVMANPLARFLSPVPAL